MSQQNYGLKDIFLVESEFKKHIENASYQIAEIENVMNINIEHATKDKELSIYLTLNINSTFNGHELFNFKIKYCGIFSIGNIDILPIDVFSKANGPAIIFPFLREHVSSLSSKAGIQQILIPPLNFQKLYNEKKIV